MAVGDKTVGGATEIASYDFLKFVNQHFGELAGHYISIFQVYHIVFASIALNIVLWGGIAWVAVQMLKAPFDRLQTAAGGTVMVVAGSFLLTPNIFSIPGAYEDVQLVNGAGYTYQIMGNIYQIFKEGLDSITDDDAFQIAFDSAYHVTDEETLKRFIDSPMAPMYEDYINLCQPAFEAAAGKNPAARVAGRYVGFYGSGGIGQAEIQWEKANGIIDKLKGTDPNLDRLVTSTSLINHDGGTTIRDGVSAGVAVLKSIPLEQNPFDGKTVPLTGYKIPTKEYWEREMFKVDNGTAPEYYDAADVEGNNYRNAVYAEDAEVSESVDKTAAYPKDCYDLYRMVDQGQRNWQAAIDTNTRVGQASALGRDGRNATMMMYTDLENQLRAQKKLHDTPLETLAGYGQVNLLDHNGGMRLGDMLKDSAYTTAADLGSWFKEKMLKYKIPMMINGCAMLAAFLIVMFPLICIMAIFISPKILASFVKLMAFAFLVQFTNDACLSMAATLLSVNGELLEGYNAGNFTRNNTLLISAGTAEYVVFVAITVIELIFAKMLIWDDVKSMGSFNPGGAAAGLAVTGAAVIGAVAKLGSMVSRGGASAAAGAGAATRVVAGGAQAASKMANQNLISGGTGRGGGHTRAAVNAVASARRMSGGKDFGEAPAARKSPGFLNNPVPTSATRSTLSRPEKPESKT